MRIGKSRAIIFIFHVHGREKRSRSFLGRSTSPSAPSVFLYVQGAQRFGISTKPVFQTHPAIARTFLISSWARRWVHASALIEGWTEDGDLEYATDLVDIAAEIDMVCLWSDLFNHGEVVFWAERVHIGANVCWKGPHTWVIYMNSGGFCHVLASKRRRMSNLPLYIRAVFSLFTVYTVHKQTGMKAFEGLHFLASLGPPVTSKRKGGEKMQPFNHFHSHPGMRKRRSRWWYKFKIFSW